MNSLILYSHPDFNTPAPHHSVDELEQIRQQREAREDEEAQSDSVYFINHCEQIHTNPAER